MYEKFIYFQGGAASATSKLVFFYKTEIFLGFSSFPPFLFGLFFLFLTLFDRFFLHIVMLLSFVRFVRIRTAILK